MPTLLTPNFSLEELSVTQTRLANAPPPEAVARLRTLAETLLEPLRAALGPVEITSGFRSAAVNRAAGGAAASAHLYGCAADLKVRGRTPTEVVAWVVQSGLVFDQAIDEFDGARRWCHLGIAKPGASPRRQALVGRSGTYSFFKLPK